MTKPVLVLLAFCFVGSDLAFSQEKEEHKKVEILLAAENAPEGMKAGDRVDLKFIKGSTISATGVVSLTTSVVARDLEVAAVSKVEKPKSKEEAIKVELRVSPGQAAKIETLKKQRVTVIETNPNGERVVSEKPVPLRLEPAKAKE